MTRTSLLAALGAAALTTFMFTTANAASGNAKADGIVVRYSQDMLNNRDDAARVYAKLKLASRKACGLVAGHLTLPERTVANRCYQQTLAEVVRKIDRPLLTSAHVSDPTTVS